ncbi:MAG: preprotein translocase subunit Sec61beta [Candidatus Methanofastidiosa archaeon]|nr:preprotein translocase subunit Sec61beta [Candidatus Methanofastidiosa archaeon]
MAKTKRESVGGALPPTGAGLIRYFDEDTQGIKIGPKLVVIASAAIAVIFIILHVTA